MQNIAVKDLMIREPVYIAPAASLEEAACKMKEANCGVLPVGTADRLEGMITDRDIVIRALADGKGSGSQCVRDYMSPDVVFCHENDSLEAAATLMQENKISRLMVKDAKDRTTGILSFGDIIRQNSKGKEIAAIVKRAVKRKAA